MKHASQSQFGRLAQVCQTSPAPTHETLLDKWEMLALLTTAAPAYELSHRTLGVLRALLTFLPTRMIPNDPQSAIVFPSNKTLGKRLNGMPESTVRRHLSHLITAGIVSRHDSPNRKRFARHAASVGQVAYGFDLSPLARELATLQRHADAVNAQAQEHAVLRAQLGHLRQRLIDLRGPCALAHDSAGALRRKPDTKQLVALCADLEEQITSEMNTTDDQNERHIQIESISISDSVLTDQMPVTDQRDCALEDVVAQCTEYQSYFPAPVRHWQDLINIADRLVPMIGIERPVFEEAIGVMGIKRATTVVLCLLERLKTINNPGGYLRRVTQMARAGRFYWGGLCPPQKDLTA